MVYGKIQIQTITNEYQAFLVSDIIQNVMSNFVRGTEYVETYLDDLLIITNSSFKEHLFNIEMVLAIFLTNYLLV
jgi:hypothetical protein